MPGRKYSLGTSTYRYSINGQEKEKELNENITTAEYWEYDSRIGRRWNVDPKPNYSESVYSVFLNNPVIRYDIKGDTPKIRSLTAGYQTLNYDAKTNVLGYVNPNGQQFVGPLQQFQANILQMYRNALDSRDEHVRGRALIELNSKFNLFIAPDQFDLPQIRGSGLTSLYAFRIPGSTQPIAAQANQPMPQNATAAYICLTGNGTPRFLTNNGVMDYSGTPQTPNLRPALPPTAITPFVLDEVHEILGHGYQAIMGWLNGDRVGPQYNSSQVLIGYPRKAEADACTIQNLFAIHFGLNGQIERYYLETGVAPNGNNSILLHKLPWMYLIDAPNSIILNNEPKIPGE